MYRTIKSLWPLITALVILSLIMTACAQPAAPTPTAAPVAEQSAAPTQAPAQAEAAAPTAAPVAAKKDVKIGYVLFGLNTFAQVIMQGAQDAGKALGVDVEVTGPADVKPDESIAMFEGLIQKGKDGLVTTPYPGEVWVTPIKEATDKGIPVMTANVLSPDSTASAWFGQAEFNSGVAIGKELVKQLTAAGVTEGEVVVGQCSPASVLVDRYNGVQEGFKGSPYKVSTNYDVTPEVTSNYSAWENLISANPKMIAAVGLCSIDVPNLAMLKERTKGNWLVAGYDLNVETLDAIKAGLADITAGQHPYLQGYLPVLALAQSLKDGKPMVKGWIDVGTELVTKNNVDSVYKREADTKYMTEWYADYIAKNFGDLNAIVKPLPTTGEKPAAAKKDVKIGYVLFGLNTFAQVIMQGAQDAGKALGVDVEVTGPADVKPDESIAMFEGLIQKGKDGLVTTPYPGEVWVTPIKEATDKGIPVMTANVLSPDSTASAWFGQAEFNSGVAIGKELVKQLTAAGVTEGEVVVGQCSPASVLVDRYNGVQEGFKGSPYKVSTNYDVTPEVTSNYSAWENLISANPKMIAAVGLCSIDVPNLAMLKERTKGNWLVAGYDLNVETLDAIKAGLADITAGQHPYLQGYLPVLALAQSLKDGKPMVKGWIDVGTELVTKNNVDSVYKREADTKYMTEWYADYIAKNFGDLNAIVKPLPTTDMK